MLEAAKASSVVSEFLDKFHNLMNLLQMDIESGQTDRSLVNSLYDVEATAMLGHNENEAVAQQAVNELKLYRVKLQEHPNTDDLRFALFWLKWRMGAVIRSTMDNDMNLKSPLLILIPESEDRNLSVIKASRALLKATYKDASDLFFYASIKCMRWCLKQKRRNELFPLLFASIAMITTRFAVSSGNFKSLKNVVHLVSASRAFDEVYWNQPERMIGSCITHAFVNHWTEPLRTCLEPLLENVKESLLFGEPELACESFCTWLRYSLYAGEKLSGVIEQILIHL